LPQPKKNKSIALKTMSEKADDSSDDGLLNDEDLTLCPKPRKGNTKNKSSKSAEKSKGDSYGTSQGKKDKDKKDKNFQGTSVRVLVIFGLKSKAKAMNVTLSDESDLRTQ
jgi:hypothetical protein